jgi:hypothetical protein
MKKLFVILLFFCAFSILAQNDTSHIIQVHFLYGSKPTKKFKSIEKKYFGGLHGGHVSIQVDSTDYGFSPSGKLHIFNHKKKFHSVFQAKEISKQAPYPKDAKVVTILIPITQQQYNAIRTIQSSYCKNAPYDYAFLGMRCAASAQDVLGQIGVVKKRKRLKNIYTTFYPKKLRKRLLKQATEKNYKIISHQGRPTRKWEKD